MFNCTYTGPQFDIVIPVHKKDLAVLEYCIAAARKKIVGARRIITISKERYTNNAEWFAESQFPFDMEFVKKYVGAGSCGWYFQQLLKLYAPLVIPDILPNVMILDSDTVFFRKTKMFDKENRPFYNISKDQKITMKPFDIRVEEHIQKLWPEISRYKIPQELQEFSGICHTMIFNREIILDLFEKVEKYDKDGDKFYKIFLKHANENHSASEYQIYFNFLLIFHFDKIALRRLRYKNTADLDIKKYQRRFKYHYCSFHSYLRNQKDVDKQNKFAKKISKLFKKLFMLESWNIGIAKCNISEFLTIPAQEIKWLSGGGICGFRADPFGIEKDEEKTIFYEEYERSARKGKIVALTLNDKLEITAKKDILDEKFHLSYPYIFTHNQKNYAFVESNRANKLELFEVLENNDFKKIRTIFDNLAVVDPSIIFHQNKFWLFFGLANKGDDELYLAHADDLFGEFKMHKNNPIKKDIMRARSAGEIFLHEGSLYRPAQNCLKTYGGSIIVNKIVTLNEEEFAEIDEIEIMPNQLGQYAQGLHNISSLGKNHTLIDGKKTVFAPYKPLIQLFRIIKKIYTKKKS